MAGEGNVYPALVIYNKENKQFSKKCRVCKADLTKAEVIRKWESGGKINYIIACPKCGRFNLYWRKRYYGRRVPDRMVG
jgi:uncharacterized Zn finger protein